MPNAEKPTLSTSESKNDDDVIHITGVIEPQNVSDDMLVEIGSQLIKDSLSHQNQSVRQFVSLNAAILAGCIALSDKAVIRHSLLMVAIAMLTIGLLAGIAGLVPYSTAFFPGAVDRIRDTVTTVTMWRRNLIWTSAGALVLALLVMVAGVFTRPDPVKKPDDQRVAVVIQ